MNLTLLTKYEIDNKTRKLLKKEGFSNIIEIDTYTPEDVFGAKTVDVNLYFPKKLTEKETNFYKKIMETTIVYKDNNKIIIDWLIK